jgi:type IV pilus biogenesis protein CpaD/CtpE
MKPQKLLLACAALMMLGGCSMNIPSQVRTADIQLEERTAAQSYDVALMTERQVESLVRAYERSGRGEMTATVAYHPGGREDMKAVQKDMQRVQAILRKKGVSRLNVEYVAQADKDLAGDVVFTYPALIARAPDHCTRLPGYQGAEGLDVAQYYEISCESKDIMSRMVARPEDLLGTDGRNAATARRAGAVVEAYQDGEPNDNFYDIKGASQVGN